MNENSYLSHNIQKTPFRGITLECRYQTYQETLPSRFILQYNSTNCAIVSKFQKVRKNGHTIVSPGTDVKVFSKVKSFTLTFFYFKY